MNIGGSLRASVNNNGIPFNVQDLVVHADGDITVGNVLDVDGIVTAGGNISAANGIFLNGGPLVAGGDITSTHGDIDIEFSLIDRNIMAGGDIFAAGTIGAGAIHLIANGSITAAGIAAREISAGTDITIAPVETGFIRASSITAGGQLVLFNTPSISYEFASSSGGIGFTPEDFILTASSISSSGSSIPTLFFDGQPANPNPGNGGNVTLNLTAGGLAIGSEDDLAGINASGGSFDINSFAGGNGGRVTINATGDVSLNDGVILATTGIIPAGGPNTLGDGGSVTIQTPGAIKCGFADRSFLRATDPWPGAAQCQRRKHSPNER